MSAFKPRAQLLIPCVLSLWLSPLAAQDTTRAYQGEGPLRLELAPAGADRALLESILRQAEPQLVVESISSLEIPPQLTSLSQAERFLRYGNSLRSISSLKGIEYFSQSLGKKRVLFLESYLIPGPDGGEMQNDPWLDSLPPRQILYARQKEAVFGLSIMRLDYRSGPASLILSMENENPLWLGPMRVAKAGEFSTILWLSEDSGRIQVYALALLKELPLKILRAKVSQSFSNRVAALSDWFRSGLYALPGEPR